MSKKIAGQTDHDLVYRVAQGDKQAFEVLFERENAQIYKFSYLQLRDEALAEDVTQETFYKLWIHAKNWTPDAQIKTWLLKVARNLCIDVLRKKTSDYKKTSAFLEEQNIHFNLIQKTNIEQEMVDDARNQIIKNAIFLLPERQKEALTLVYYSECSGSQAADIMGVTVSALESLLARARRGLRMKLSGQKTDLMETIDAKKQ